jgi:hypothetical protein
MQGLCLVYSQLGIAKRQSRVFYNYLILSEPHMPTIAKHFSIITQLKRGIFSLRKTSTILESLAL